VRVVDLKDLKPGFKLDLFMQQRMSTQDGLKQYGFQTPAEKMPNLISDPDYQDDGDEDNRLFKKTNRPVDLREKLSQTVRAQNKKMASIPQRNQLLNHKSNSKRRHDARASDFRMTAEKILGSRMDSKAALPPLGRDASKSKVDMKNGLKTAMGQFASEMGRNSSLGRFEEVKRSSDRGYDS
jgi:hypothetical protein